MDDLNSYGRLKKLKTVQKLGVSIRFKIEPTEPNCSKPIETNLFFMKPNRLIFLSELKKTEQN